jgi:L-seryl-tRNA(Ser) seleniumtransferase
MSPAVIDAWVQAAQVAVPLDQLQAAAARRIAAMCDTESALVVSGAAAGLMLGTAAILAGLNLARIERLPDTSAMPHEFLVARPHRNGYDHAVRAAGARLIEVGIDEIQAGAGVRSVEIWEFEAAIGPATAGVLYTLTSASQPPLAEVVRWAHAHQLPVLVDAAGQLPPVANLSTIGAMGADLVVFSGGKAIGGPQSTGILCGRRDLVGSAFLQMMDNDERFELWQPPTEFLDKNSVPGIPRQGIGRTCKVSKEAIVALLAALEEFTEPRQRQRHSEQLEWLERMRDRLAPLAREVAICGDDKPRLAVRPDPNRSSRSLLQICQSLRQGKPPIYVGVSALGQGQLTIDPACLDASTAQLVAERLAIELNR